MDKIFRPLIYSAFVLFFLFSCKKDSNNNPPATASLAFEKNDYVSYEVASIISNSSMNSTSYTATIDGTVSVTLERTDSFLVFIMPVLSTGAHILTVNLGNGEQTLNFNILQGNSIADPDQYFQNYVSVYDNRMLDNFTIGDTLLTGTEHVNFLADQQTISNHVTTAIQNFSTLSVSEKNQVVQFLDANKGWMDELQSSINDLKTIMGQLRVNVVDDYDLRVSTAMTNFLKVRDDIIRNNVKIIVLVGASCYFGTFACIVGVGAGLGYFISEIQKLNLTIDELMDAIYYPFYNLLGQRPVTVVFENGVPRDFVVTMDYRTIYSADANSSVPLVQKIVGALFAIKNQWNLLISKIPFNLSYGPRDLNSISTYNTSNKRIHSRYLSISNISSAQTTSAINRLDGFFYLTFTNPNLSSTQSFNFNVNYNNSDMGSFSYNVSADLNVSGLCTNSFSPLGTFVDSRDGNIYKTVTIGSKVWFAENLRFNSPGSDVLPGYPCDSYGRLYNWQIASTSCPAGWHLSTFAEWTDLVNYAGGANIAGLALKSTQGWNYYLGQGNGNNSIGFNVLPAGNFYQQVLPTNLSLGDNSSFWTSDEIDAFNAKYTSFGFATSSVQLVSACIVGNGCDKIFSFSCRCVQD